MTNWQEWIGYLASFLVAVSLLMSSMRRLRWINMTGSLVFTVYGFIIQSWPVVFMNIFLVAVNIWFIIKLANKKLKLHLKPERWDEPLIEEFLSQNHDDIQRFFPSVTPKSETSLLFIIYNGFEISGLLAGNVIGSKLMVKALFLLPKFEGFNFNEKFFKERKLALRAFDAKDYQFESMTKKGQLYLKKFHISP